MATTATSSYQPIPANPEVLERLVSALAERWGKELRIIVHYAYDDGGSDIRTLPGESLVTLIPVALPISCLSLSPKDTLGGPDLNIHVFENRVVLGASDETMTAANDLKDLAVEALGLEPMPVDDNPERVSTLERRVDAVQRIQEEGMRLRAFLSFRFGGPDSELARDLDRFLNLNNVEVVTGQSYEPRRVEDKVRSRLSGVDFVVYLLTSTGDSAWVRDEIATAQASETPVIPLVEEGIEFDQGLFGNVEWIRFASGHIGDVWIQLTEAIKYIRARRARSIESVD